MNRGQIRTRVQQRLDRSDSTFNTLVDTWLTEVIQIIENAYPFDYLKKTQEIDPVLTPDNGIYSLPSSLILHHPWMFLLQLTSDLTRFLPLTRINDRQFRLWITSPDTPTGQPEYYILEGGTDGLQFRLYPVPDVADDLRIYGGYFYTDTSSWNDSSSNWLMVQHPHLIVEGISAQAFEHYGEFDSAQRAYQLFQTHMNGDRLKGISGVIQNEIKKKHKGRFLRVKTREDFPVDIAKKHFGVLGG